MLHEIEQRMDFFLDLLDVLRERNEWSGIEAYLVRHAKYMRVVLDETTRSGKASQRTACLISMEDAKFGHSYGQLFVATIT